MSDNKFNVWQLVITDQLKYSNNRFIVFLIDYFLISIISNCNFGIGKKKKTVENSGRSADTVRRALLQVHGVGGPVAVVHQPAWGQLPLQAAAGRLRHRPLHLWPQRRGRVPPPRLLREEEQHAVFIHFFNRQKSRFLSTFWLFKFKICVFKQIVAQII